MKISAPASPPRGENTIALINVVFLLLVFLLVAGSIASQEERSVELASSAQAEAGNPAGGALVMTADGVLRLAGTPVSAALLATRREPDAPLRIAVDRGAPAQALISTLADLRAAGFSDIGAIVARSGEASSAEARPR